LSGEKLIPGTIFAGVFLEATLTRMCVDYGFYRKL